VNNGPNGLNGLVALTWCTMFASGITCQRGRDKEAKVNEWFALASSGAMRGHLLLVRPSLSAVPTVLLPLPHRWSAARNALEFGLRWRSHVRTPKSMSALPDGRTSITGRIPGLFKCFFSKLPHGDGRTVPESACSHDHALIDY
jgi:hypothetical protein